MSSADETTAYFNAITKKFGTGTKLIGLGQGAWVLKNSDAVVRKDYKVLFVNVAGIPAQFSAVDEALRRVDQHRVGDHGLLERELTFGVDERSPRRPRR